MSKGTPIVSQSGGLDAEIAAKRIANYNYQGESEAMSWITQVTGITLEADFWRSLKSGVVLCTLINTLQPGICRNFNPHPKHWLEEKDNVNKYIKACEVYGVPSQDLFSELDLSETKKDMIPVLQNIFSVARLAQAHGWTGPQLGVRYYKSIEDIRRLEEKKQKEKEEDAIRRAEYDEDRAKRLAELENENRSRKKQEATKLGRRKNRRRKMRKLRGKKLQPFQEEVIPPERDNEPAGAVKYGMDYEIQKRRMKQFDLEVADAIMNWIEDLTGEEIDYFWECLKSGRILCLMINKIRPGSIPKINPPGKPLAERENILKFLNYCSHFGVNQFELFDVNDLYNNQDLVTVLRCITALGRAVTNKPWYTGPNLVLPNPTNQVDDNDFEASDSSVSEFPGTPLRGSISLPDSIIEIEGVEVENTYEGDLSRRLDGNIDTFSPSYRCFSQFQVRGLGAIFLSIFVLILCAGGNFGEFWFRGILVENSNIYQSLCGQNNTECRASHVDEIFIIGASVSYFGFTIGGILFDLFGPKITGCCGTGMKIIGSLLLALISVSNSEDTQVGMIYTGYMLFQAGGSLILISVFHIISHPLRTTSLYTTFVAIYYCSGGWIFYAIFVLVPMINYMTVFLSYSGVLILLFFIVLFFWPIRREGRDGYAPVTSQEKTPITLARNSVLRIRSTMNLHFVFLCFFVAVTLTKANFFWNFIATPIKSSLSTTYGYTVSSVGITSALIALLIDKIHVSVHVAVIVLLALIEGVLGFPAENSGILLTRFIAFGIYVPYVIGFSMSLIRLKNMGSCFGLAVGIIGLLSCCLNATVFTILGKNLSYEEKIIKDSVLVGIVALFSLYTILHFVMESRKKKKVTNV